MALESLILGISHVGVRVRELKAARSFYEKLGFKFIAGPIGPEPVAILKHPSGIVLNLVLNGSSEASGNILMDGEAKYPGYTHVAIAVSDIASAQADLESRGIRLTEGPVKFPGATAIFVRDQDGNVIEFNQAEPGRALEG